MGGEISIKMPVYKNAVLFLLNTANLALDKAVLATSKKQLFFRIMYNNNSHNIRKIYYTVLFFSEKRVILYFKSVVAT